jgi:hypothetical protein
MDASQLRYLEIVHYARNKTISSFYVPMVSKMLRNTPKHHFGSNVVEWMLLNFGAPKKCIQGRNTSFASFYVPKVREMLWNTPKHLFGSNVVEWMLLNFGAPKKCIQARNTSFASFYVPKASEMLWNTPKHHFRSNVEEWMLRNCYPEIVHSGPKHEFFIFLGPKASEMI